MQEKSLILIILLVERENWWHNELNCTFGTDFWNAASTIKNGNRMKWLQYPINRNCLFTNYKVNKFKPNNSPFCSFCSQLEGVSNLELISHLLFECDCTLQLWQVTKNWLQTFNKKIPLNINLILFGIHNQPRTSVENFVILCVKYFICKTKFQTAELYFTCHTTTRETS